MPKGLRRIYGGDFLAQLADFRHLRWIGALFKPSFGLEWGSSRG